MGCRCGRQPQRLSGILSTPPDLKMGTGTPMGGRGLLKSHNRPLTQPHSSHTSYKCRPLFFSFFSNVLSDWWQRSHPLVFAAPVAGLLAFLLSSVAVRGPAAHSQAGCFSLATNVLCPNAETCRIHSQAPHSRWEGPRCLPPSQETLPLGMPVYQPTACGTAPRTRIPGFPGRSTGVGKTSKGFMTPGKVHK